MKVTVDQDVCASSGNCVMNAPEVFDQRDDDGVVVLLNPSPAADQAEVQAGGGRLSRPGHPHRGIEMSDILTSATTEQTADIPDYPMARGAALPVRPAAGRHGAGRVPAAVSGADLGWQYAVAHHRLRASARAVLEIRASASTTGCPASRTGTKACCRPCTSGPGRCSPPTASTPGSGGCCPSPSRSGGWRVCARRSSRSPTTTSTRCWPARSPRMSLPPLPFPFRRW